MVKAVRRGKSQRSVARRFGVSLSTVQHWLAHAKGRRLDRVDWSDRDCGPVHAANRTPTVVEDRIVQLRHSLWRDSDLGEHGASAIRRALVEERLSAIPSERTIGRVLARRGLLDGRRRIRRPPPPPGWYLPEVATGNAELDQVDIIEGLALRGGRQLEVLNTVSLHGGLVGSWPQTAVSARFVADTLPEHWNEVGLPAYAQFDNDTVFQGPHQHRDVISRVMRVCLTLGVVPVFAPPRESGFQANIENYNGQWQVRVFARFIHPDLEALKQRSARYVAAHRRRSASRQERAPARRDFPAHWRPDLQAHPQGRLVYLRRTTEKGHVSLLGRDFAVDPLWCHRLVRCEVLLDAQHIRFYRLRRREPHDQPLLNELPYSLPRRRFRE